MASMKGNPHPRQDSWWSIIWAGALLVITWPQFTLSQQVLFPTRVDQPLLRVPNSVPVPNGAHILLLTNSPVSDEALRKYDQTVIAAVRQSWFDLLKNSRSHLAGTNITEFELSSDGSIKRLARAEKSGSSVLDMICECAIQMPAPFARLGQGKDESRKFRVAFVLPDKK